MFDLIFISMENWDDIWRRNQFLCAEIAKRHQSQNILFVGLPRDVSNRLKQGKIAELLASSTYAVPGIPQITVTHPLKLFPNSFAWGRRANEWLFRRRVKRMARKLKMRDPVLWINPHSAGHLAGELHERCCIYDITDDWALSTMPEKERAIIESQDRELCGKADLTIVCSESLFKSRRELAKEILLLSNGVDVDHYASIASAEKDPTLPRPVFGYTGTLHPDRIDPALIEAVAKAFPNGSIQLIGPNHLPNSVVERLKQSGNVQFVGPVPYSLIPDRMGDFDVCFVPHLETDFTESLNPIKLWEYLASGKPIVSSNVAGFRDYRNLCHIGSGPEAFVQACRDALSENGTTAPQRRAEAHKHTWSSRVDELLTALKTLNRDTGFQPVLNDADNEKATIP